MSIIIGAVRLKGEAKVLCCAKSCQIEFMNYQLTKYNMMNHNDYAVIKREIDTRVVLAQVYQVKYF